MEFDFAKFLIVFPVLLFSMTAHEWAHGYAAWKQGDPTSYRTGYVTWNPIKYVDPIMTIIVPIITFMTGFPFMGMRSGPIDARNFRNYRRGDLIVSFAGVFANLVLAFVCAVLFIVLGLIARMAPAGESVLSTLQHMTAWGMLLNLFLVGINTLPLPPFDGSALPRHFLPPAWAIEYSKLVPYGFLIMLFIFTIGRPILAFWLGPAFATLAFLQRLTYPFSLAGSWSL